MASLLVAKDRNCLRLTLNRPQVLNAVDTALRDALFDAIDSAENDSDVRLIVLDGAGGRAFSAGADVKEIARLGASDPSTHIDPSSDSLARCTKPVIAAVDGIAYGLGFELALRADIRVCTAASTFALPEPRRSLLAGYGLHHLSRMVPLGEALRIQLTGAPIGAERAYQIGLVQALCASRAALDEEVGRIADDIIACAPLAVQGIKTIVRQGREMSPEQSWQLAAPISAAVARSADRQEGPRAFVEKRAPRWTGR